jgi:predicted ATPase
VHLPAGTVTLLLTDIEGSTRLIEELGENGYVQALAEHRRLLRRTLSAHGGVEVDTQGDAFLYAFADPVEALAAAAEGQEALATGAVRVRMGLHTGELKLTGEGYAGRELHRAARIAASGHGGQVVVSAATRTLLDVELTELGEHRLKDFDEPVPLFQLGTKRFPPLKTISNTNLPRPVSSFVGREQERNKLLSLVRNGSRLVTLSGPGGSGKTRLAVDVATELVPDFSAGVFWVGLSALRDPALVTEAIGQVVGAKGGLADQIGERELLLLLDNFEQVVEAAPELSPLLEVCPNLRFLVTSRELLRIRGEVEYPVPPLAESEAIELFCTRSRLRPDETIAELCRRLDDMPLALELAAARTHVLTPAQIVDRLGQRLDLFRGRRDADPRQQSLRATIEWSHDLLADDEQQLFARLAAFAGGCTLDAAEDVCDADLDLLQSLVDKGLLRHTGGRFWMLESIREYASERLHDSGEAGELAERHARWYLGLAKSAYPDFRRPTQNPLLGADAGKWLARLDAELKNFRSAIGWGRDHDPLLEVELVKATRYFLNALGYFAEVYRYLLQALETARSASLDPAELLYGAGFVADSMGDLAAAQRWAEQLLELARAHGDALLASDALSQLANIARRTGDPERARALYLDAAEAARESDNTIGLMVVARGFATMALETRDAETARTHFQRELQLARELPHPFSEAIALAGLCRTALLEGDTDNAAACLDGALRLANALGIRAVITECVTEAAEIAEQRGELVRAARLLGAADALCEMLEIPLDQSDRELRTRITSALGDDVALTAAQSEGRMLTIDEAVAYALGDSG